jgi:hypothetical protein
MPVFFLRPWFGLPTGSGYLGAPDQPLVTYSDRRTLSLLASRMAGDMSFQEISR